MVITDVTGLDLLAFGPYEVRIRPLTLDQAREAVRVSGVYASAVSDPSTAEVFSDLLGVRLTASADVPRVTAGAWILVGRLLGTQPPEPPSLVPQTSVDWFLVEVRYVTDPNPFSLESLYG